MSAHTPGPWIAEDDTGEFQYIRPADYEPDHGFQYIAEVRGLSNARLIAAAPDLLAVAKTALRGEEIIGRGNSPIANNLRAAIARATGDNDAR
jgi:hypothetical protein